MVKHPSEAVKGKMRYGFELFRLQRKFRSVPDASPECDAAEKFSSVIAELNLRSVQLIGTVRADSSENIFVTGDIQRSGTDFFGQHRGRIAHDFDVPREKSAVKDVGGNEDPVVSSVARSLHCLQTDFERLFAERGGERENLFSAQQQNLRHAFRNRHFVVPPVAVDGTFPHPELHAFPERIVKSRKCSVECAVPGEQIEMSEVFERFP